MPGVYSIAFRTRCPICGERFPAGYSLLHYGEIHRAYARWAGRWEFFLYGSIPLAFLLVVVIGFGSRSLLYIGRVQAGFAVCVVGSIVIWLSNLLRVERGFRLEWAAAHPRDDTTKSKAATSS